MQIDGYGGRAGNHQNETLAVLKGRRTEEWISFYVSDHEPMPERNCANPKCGRLYQPRAEGDDYCNERCDPLNKFKTAEGMSDD